MDKTVAIIQARMGSSRLPGKVLLSLNGRSVLGHIHERVRKARHVDEVVIATSTEAVDDPVVEFCEREGMACYRGSEQDVLDRFYHAAKEAGAGTVVRITGDCPLADPSVIDRVIEAHHANGDEYTTNVLRPTYPDGLDVEVFSFEALERAWIDTTDPTDRQHVTGYITTSGTFRLGNVVSGVKLHPLNDRWTLDDRDDLRFIQTVYERFEGREDEFTFEDVMVLLQNEPALNEINRRSTRNEGWVRDLYKNAVAGAARPINVTRSQEWLARSKRVIPGASQTFSKGHTQFVQGVSPVFLQRGKGAYAWDVDGNEYIDYIQGLLPNILGYAHDEVNAAAYEQLQEGHSFSLPHPLEVTLAEKLVEIIPCAEMVRFGKNGSDATSGAIRAARAYTGRDRIASCGYHGWQDWYIGATLRNLGVPEATRGLTHKFPYNDLAALRTLLEEHPGEFAAVIMEPVNFVPPEGGYLEGVKQLAHEHGALLIFDEICSGWHFGLGGAQKRFGVTPDMATFGKAMGNGWPISAVVGSREIMPIFDDIFFSFTFGGEAASMAASLKVIEILETTDALDVIEENGRLLQDGFNVLAREAGIEDRYWCDGYPFWSVIHTCNAQGDEDFLEFSLFQQETVKRGILSNALHNLTPAHTIPIAEQTLEVYAGVLKTLSRWLDDPNPERFLEGSKIQPVFKAREKGKRKA